jgi:hypothetical protein
MNATREDLDDTVVIEPAELRPVTAFGARRDPLAALPPIPAIPARVEDRRTPRAALARGTRETTVPTFELERDPVAVLKMWPATARPPEPAPPPVPLVRRRVDDKVALAHLALDLYRELGQLDAAHGHGNGAAAGCGNQACEARISALRGGLVEACLLVQRVVMMPGAIAGVEDDVRELLALVDRDPR